MAFTQLIVPIGEKDESGQWANSPAEIFEQIKRRGIRPMNILEDEHRRLFPALQLA